VKNGAMQWVYFVEWIATSSVLFFSSFAIWTLMIRRSMYREVGTTGMSKKGFLE
jgi:hypothetical protein